MRSLEFIAEKINPRVAQPDFYAEKIVNTRAGKMRLVARGLAEAPRSVPQFVVNAYDERGEDVARVRFVVADYDPDPPKKLFGMIRMYPERDPYIVAGNASVRYMLQRQGIGTAIYDFVRELGNDIRPSRSQSDAARAMWRSFNRGKKEVA